MWLRHLLHNQWLWRGLFYPLVAFILFLATSPMPKDSLDKINHLAAFLVMAVLMKLAHRRLHAVYLLLILGSFGMAIEIIQHFLPYRVFSLLDWLVDMGGVALGLCLVRLALAYYGRSQTQQTNTE